MQRNREILDSSRDETHPNAHARVWDVDESSSRLPKPRLGIVSQAHSPCSHNTPLRQQTRLEPPEGTQDSSSQATIQVSENLRCRNPFALSPVVSSDSFPNLRFPSFIDRGCFVWFNACQDTLGEGKPLIRRQFYRLLRKRFHRFRHARILFDFADGVQFSFSPNGPAHLSAPLVRR
jgi:hypothetical protein